VPEVHDLLVVGAGPTGLMLALQLARRGLRPLIIDRHTGPARETRALGVQARTLEIYSHLGIAGRALALGTRATGANLWVRGRRRARVPLGDIGRDLSPYPFLLILGQDDNERLLGEALHRDGVDVQWNTELVGLTQRDEQVVVALKRGPTAAARAAAPAEELAVRWVGGCDGARSGVRSALGIEFTGAPYEHVFFVADTTVTGPMQPGELNVYLLPDRFHLLFPMRGRDHWRVVGILPPGLAGRDDVRFDDVLPSLRTETATPLAFSDCSWFSTYRIHHRRAARFRDGRCFLLGDAAHIHSPVGAQGMNTGLQDAYNLAWKLALVLAGRVEGAAADRLLDTYAAEREPVAERLLRTTDQGFRAIVSDNALAGWLRTRVAPRALALAMRSERARLIAFRTISQIGIRYPASRLSQTLPGRPAGTRAGGPSAGDRFPWMRLVFAPGGAPEDLFSRLDDTRFTLLLFGQLAPPAAELAGLAAAEILDVLAPPDDPANAAELDRARIARPSYWLLRPDGHIGLAGARFDTSALESYIEQRLGLSRKKSGTMSIRETPVR